MSNSDENEKTRIKPNSPIAPVPEDKTRIIAPKLDANSTRIKPSVAPEANPNLDKTQFAPKPKPKVEAPTPTNNPVPNDSTRFKPKAAANFGPAPLVDGGSRPVVENKAQLSDFNIPDNLNRHTILKERFILEETLGAGGMGVVYKAKDRLKVEAQDRDPYVAIKVLVDEFKAHPDAFIALQRESRKTQRIAHPNIVTVFDFDRDGETVFMTMEYLDGQPLDKLIAQYRSVGLPHEEVFKILEGMCAALIYAHGENIIHSDFKPGNIFVNTKGIAKVIDFGIARAVAKVENRAESVDDRTVFDAANLGALTPAYASLEMLEGENPDVRDDIYALGCIAYELYTGAHPFNRIHADEAKRQKLKPKKIPSISKRQWLAIEHALAFDRENRTPTVAVFWQEFTQTSNHKGKLIAVALLLLLVGAFLAYVQLKPEPIQTLPDERGLRSEIEQQLRLENQKKSLDELILQANFLPAWEIQVWKEIQEVRGVLSEKDEWLLARTASLFQLYVQKINTAVVENDLDNAQIWVANASRYTGDKTMLEALTAQILAAIEQKRQQQLEAQIEAQKKAEALSVAQERLDALKQKQVQEEKVKAKMHSDFDAALANVQKQTACNGTIDMRDFEIAITQLRTLDSVAYKKVEPEIVNGLVQCIQKIGGVFPDRAEVIKTQSLRLFNGNIQISKIIISAKDACNDAIAGLGARGMAGICRDRLAGATKAPAMVVIPALENGKSFAIGKYEVSVEEINEFCNQSGQCSADKNTDASMPVTNIPIATINSYLKWLSDKSKHIYRLPKQIEWQLAAKGKTGSLDPNRNCKLNSRGIQKGSALYKATLGQQNAWGMVNMIGNARELVVQGGGYLAVGGSYETDMKDCDLNGQVAHDGKADPLTSFRVVRELQ